MDNIDFFLIVVSGFFNENDLITNNDPLNPKCLYPLHFAAENGHLNVVEYLLNQKADINAKDSDDSTPLHRASENGHLSVVEYLVNQNADINAKDNSVEFLYLIGLLFIMLLKEVILVLLNI